MIPEEKLRELEASDARRGYVPLRLETLCQFIAAARVANAAARVEREERDAAGRHTARNTEMEIAHSAPDDPTYHVDRARAGLARALARYTAGEPAKAGTR